MLAFYMFLMYVLYKCYTSKQTRGRHVPDGSICFFDVNVCVFPKWFYASVAVGSLFRDAVPRSCLWWAQTRTCKSILRQVQMFTGVARCNEARTWPGARASPFRVDMSRLTWWLMLWPSSLVVLQRSTRFHRPTERSYFTDGSTCPTVVVSCTLLLGATC